MSRSFPLKPVCSISILGYSILTHYASHTAKHFDRDPETNEMLWFSAPPVNVAHPPTPKHSLKYLHFLAMKGIRQNVMDVDDVAEKKKQRLRVPPTVTETLRAILADAPTLEWYSYVLFVDFT